MKKIVLAFALLVFGSPAFLLTHAADTETKGKIVILRVTSTNPKEELSFEASYLLGNTFGKITHVAQKTPFEVKTDAEFVNGMFQKTGGEGDLQVTVSRVEEETETRLVLGSSDNIIIVTPQAEVSKNSKKFEYIYSIQAYSKQQ